MAFLTHQKPYPALGRLLARRAGQSLVEYALVVATIAVGAVGSMDGLFTEIKTAFNVISSHLSISL